MSTPVGKGEVERERKGKPFQPSKAATAAASCFCLLIPDGVRGPRVRLTAEYPGMF